MSKKRYVCEVDTRDSEGVAVFKRYGKNEDEVRKGLQRFLESAYPYGNYFQILSVEPDKTKTV